MKTYLQRIIFFLFLAGPVLSAQNAISGYVNLQNPDQWENKVYLSQVAVEGLENETKMKSIAIADIRKDGFFKFDRKYLSGRNKIYSLHIKRIQQIINDTITKDVKFISSNQDRVTFPKGDQIFAKYSNSNVGDKEWKRLKAFESQLTEQYLTQEESSQPRKGFVKDSLQILMVKLIGIKQLDKKNLLEKDIEEHPQFYLELLVELEESDINPSEYAFLDRKLAYLTNLKTEERLKWSLGLNLGLLLMLFGVLVFALKFRYKKSEITPIALSRQETTIKNLILEGKTNKQIANELFISISTVKTHITNLYAKLNVSNRGELLKKNTGTST